MLFQPDERIELPFMCGEQVIESTKFEQGNYLMLAPRFTPKSRHIAAMITLAGTRSRMIKRVVVVVFFLTFALINIRFSYGPSAGSQVDLDSSALSSLGVTLRQGQLSGRDFFNQYGVLSQAFVALTAGINHGGNALEGFGLTLLGWQLLAGGLMCCALTLLPNINWVWTLFSLVGCTVLNGLGYVQFRPFFLVIFALLLYRTLAAPNWRRRERWLVGTAFFTVVLQLIIIDAWVYALLTAGAVCFFYTGATLLFRGKKTAFSQSLLRPRDYLIMLIVIVGINFLANLFIAIMFALTAKWPGPLFQYQVLAFESIVGYNANNAAPWALAPAPTVMLGLMIVFAAGFTLVTIWQNAAPRGYALLCLLTVSVLNLKSAVTRADTGHLNLGTTPMILFFLLCGAAWANRGLMTSAIKGAAWVGVLVGFAVVWPYTAPDYLDKLRIVLSDLSRVGAQFDALRSIRIPLAVAVGPAMVRSVDTTKPSIAFPYDNYYLTLLGLPYANPITLAYEARSAVMEQYYAHAVEDRKASLQIIYSANRPQDTIQDVTRVPLIFETIYRNFASDDILPGGNAVLQPVASPRTDMRKTPLAWVQTGLPDHPRMQLIQPARCSMLQISLNMVYPITNFLGRSNPVTAVAEYGGTVTQVMNIFALERNRPFTTFISLVDPAETLRMFGTGPVKTAPVDAIELHDFPTGLFGVPAQDIAVQQVDCVTFERGTTPDPLPPIYHASAADAQFNVNDPALWEPHHMQYDAITGRWTALGDPYIVYRPPIDLCLADFATVQAQLAAPPGAAATIQVFVQVNGESAFSEAHSVTGLLVPNGSVYRYNLDLGKLNFPPDTRLTGLRFDPVSEGAPGSGSSLQLVDLRLVRRPGSGTAQSRCTRSP
jgi:hypothetical protein